MVALNIPGQCFDLPEDLDEELGVAVLERDLLDGVLAAVHLVPGAVDGAETALRDEAKLVKLTLVSGKS